MSSGYPDYEGGKQKVYLTPEWAALIGVDKTFTATFTYAIFEDEAVLTYLVPAGKEFYVTQIGYSSRAMAAADADKDQVCQVEVEVDTDTKAYGGAHGGGFIVPATPIKVIAGETLKGTIRCFANHDSFVGLAVVGYEVDA